MFGAVCFSRQVLILSLLGNIACLTVISHFYTTTHGPPGTTLVPDEYTRPVFVVQPEELPLVPIAPAAIAPLAAPAPRCGMCDVAPELCAEIGTGRMDKSVSYAGSNKRLRRALKKMRSGEPWVMGVIGGSVSTGHGINWGHAQHNPPHHPKYRAPNMHRLIFDHLDSRFPSSRPVVYQALTQAKENITPQQLINNVSFVDVAAYEGPLEQDVAAIERPIGRAYGFSAREKGVNSMINGAQGATGSGYFAYCFAEHIPEDVDLVIIEQAINDERNVWTIDTYETMIRALMDLPNAPAIITIETYALMFQQMAMGGDMGINEYYDLPSISVRNPFIHDTFANISMVAKHFRVEKDAKEVALDDIDTRHVSHYMHEKAGQLVSAYIDSQICQMKAEDGDWLEPDEEDGDGNLYKGQETVDPLPRLRLNGPFDLTTRTPPLRPSCFSTTSVRHKLLPSANDGKWTEWAWKEKKYLVAKEVGATVSFSITVALGTVNIIFQRSAIYGLGSAACWIEGYKETSSRILQGYWKLEYNLLQTVAIESVVPGNHTVTCEILGVTGDPQGGHEFRIASITSI